MSANRPVLGKSASDSNLKGDGGANDENAGSDGSDLNKEVAALSEKLIHAINHQTKLDHELEVSKLRIQQLEEVAREHADKMAKESMQRGQAEKDKRHIEQELENLTTALFDEANKVVRFYTAFG